MLGTFIEKDSAYDRLYQLKVLSVKHCPIVGVCNCSMFCCTLLYVHFSIAIILMGKRELIA